MRYFFLIFLCIGLIFCPQTTSLNAEEVSDKGVFLSSDLTELLKNGMDGKSPLSEKKGIGDWVKTSYGKIRLLSRESGTKDMDQILMALEVKIDPDTTIKESALNVSQTQNVKEYQLFTPVSLPLNETDGLIYEKEVVFPILLTLQKNSFPVQIKVKFDTQYCIKEVCQPDSQETSLYVSGGYNYFTPFSNFIHSSLRFIPVPATADQIQIGRLSDKAFWVILQLSKKIQNPKFLFLDNQTLSPIPYSIIQTDLDDNRALVVFRTEECIANKKIILYFSDEKQLLTQTTDLKPASVPLFLADRKNFFPPFHLWIIFLVLSPCLYLLLQQAPKNEIEAKQTTKKNILGIILGTLCGIFIYTFIPYSVLSNSVLWLSFGLLLFGFLSAIPYPVTHFGYGVLNAIVPFFFFLKNNDISIPATFTELTYFFCTLTGLNALIFVIFLFKPYWLVKIGKIFEKQPQYKLRFSLLLDTLLFGIMLLFTLFR